MRALLSFVGGIVLAAVSVLVWSRLGDPCLGRCGEGTECKEQRCVARAPAGALSTAPAPTSKRPRRSRSLDPAAPEAQLRPGDERMVAQGEPLGRTERVDFNQADAKELTQDDLDRVCGGASPAIERCITEALGDVPLASGRVNVGFRVESSGNVSRVRVEAPAVLQQHGLYRCVRGAVQPLRFPASGGGSVVNYPFELK